MSVKSLRTPAQKMSKSDPDPKSRINLTDTPHDIRTKIKKAMTDFNSAVTFDPENRKSVANLISIHSAVSGLSPDEICKQSQGLETAQYKMVVADAVIEKFEPIRCNMCRLCDDLPYLEKLLQKGAEQASNLAAGTLKEVKQLVGFT